MAVGRKYDYFYCKKNVISTIITKDKILKKIVI